MEISLKGKVVLVTGGSRGIGKAISEGLANAGATVAVHFNSSQAAAEELCEKFGNGAKPFQASLEEVDSVILLFKQVTAHYGRFDVLVNNAGVAVSSYLTKNDSDWLDDWDRTFAVNTRATGLLCKKAIEHYSSKGGGRIINISSRAAFRGDTMDYLAYGASKGAIPSLTRSIARHCGKQNIKAFNIAPGFVRTDMAQDFMDQYGESFALDDIALPELTEAKDLAPMVVLLASGLADHATGSTIDINAGSYVH
ncbi:3-oxoacyl-ACP reductase [Roseivirga sp. 4D4]|uniref:SDR family NAD(P)-dependent oxidoreductase n=1 Tax=Roseivirga sp. 4D4 TaxID=1889784 RepID=UPI000852A427|nr:SDR family oxidoreductase [Roseivirga sp. 4D4]OEK02694.1 3-oxoacyl-ACP reductase [Roseivirga sp. 4D4]